MSHPLVLLAMITASLSRDLSGLVDDTNGDSRTGSKPQYTPPFVWTGAGNPSFQAVDDDRLNDKSMQAPDFRGSSYTDANVTFTFEGTNIDIYVVCGISTAPHDPALVFYVDDERMGQYTSGSHAHISYNQSVFTGELFPRGGLVVQFLSSDFAFDYAFYQSDGSSPPRETVATFPSTAGFSSTQSTTGSASLASDTPATTGARALAPPGVRVLIAVVATAEGAVIALCAFYFIWRHRRRKGERAKSQTAAGGQEGSTTAAAQINPFWSQPDASMPLHPQKDYKTRWNDEESSPEPITRPLWEANTEDVRAELARVLRENERARIAYEHAQAAIEELRLAAGPPPHSSGGRSSH